MEKETRVLKPQHQRAIEKLVGRYGSKPDVIAIIIGGSIAKGTEREDSDIDVMIVVTEEEYERLRQQVGAFVCLYDICDYEGGYVDLQFITKRYLESAAERGSEPTRYAFAGAYCAYTHDEEIPALIGRIPVYPRGEKAEKVFSFYCQLLLNKTHVWEQAVKRDDIYLKGRTATDLVLFGGRLILAHNEMLFPCQMGLMEAVSRAREKPENYMDLAWGLLGAPTTEKVIALSEAVEGFRDWGIEVNFDKILTRYVDDTELWWWKNRPNIAEW